MQRGLLARHAPSDLVAFGTEGTRTARDLMRDVATLSAALPTAPRGSEVTLVMRKDRYTLAVAILSAWTRDFVPVLPPELDRDAITMLADATVCVLHDTASGIPIQVNTVLAEAEARRGSSASPGHSEIPPADAFLERALGSRSYGRAPDGALVAQRYGEDWLRQAQALAEAIDLRRGQRCASSVGTEHAHGIVLGVLLPLLSGAAFLREPLAPDALPLALTAQAVDVLVSIPAHLPELIASAGGRPSQLTRVISALGALPASLRDSTRTGLGANLSDLSEAAPHVPVVHCKSGDTPTEECEREARLERFVRDQKGVRDAAVLSARSTEAEPLLVAVVGEIDLAVLRALLARHEDGRGRELKLLSLGKIRRDGIGRTPGNELLRRFGLRPDGSAVNFALRWDELSAHVLEDRVEHRARVHIPADYGYFDGHFPSYPILPGAAQLSELVLPCVRRARPDLARLVQMSRLKFTGRIKPGETIDVVLSARAQAAVVDFSLKRDGMVCSAGSLSFAGPEELARGTREQGAGRP
jgi:3-hydroxymyristoyl/3-hydroxydecanoyl-(acyl carrier protein) dehydratase